MSNWKERFKPLFIRMSKADKSLNEPVFYEMIAQELKRERFEGYKQGVKDEIECVETSGEHADLRAKLKKVKGSQSH